MKKKLKLESVEDLVKAYNEGVQLKELFDNTRDSMFKKYIYSEFVKKHKNKKMEEEIRNTIFY